MSPKDPHAAHQRLMQTLTIKNAAIKAHSRTMAQKKGKVDQDSWEYLVAQLKRLEREKKAINDQIKRLK